MGQPGFFDLSDRLNSLSRLGDNLEALNEVVDWETFRPALEAAFAKERKSKAGRKPYDLVLMFKVLVLQALYNLSDDRVEFQIRDRLTFMRFLGLGLEDAVPDAKTVWLFRDHLADRGVVAGLFAGFDETLGAAGYLAQGGQIVDASIVPVPRQRNSRAENAAIKAGEVPAGWKDQPAKLSQKDLDARWTKKHGKSYYGYKNHLSVDKEHKLVRAYAVSDAAVHDSRMFEAVLDRDNTCSRVWADSAYRSRETEDWLKENGFFSRIHWRGKRNKPLSEHKQGVNRRRASVRARVEHVFATQSNDMGGKFARTIGLTRATAKIGMMNLAYNLRRYAWLERRGDSPVPA